MNCLPYSKYLKLFSLNQVYQSHGEDANNSSLYMYCSTSNKVRTKVKVMDRRSWNSLRKTQSSEVIISGKHENRNDV
jgi:hypothetical protein